MPDYERALICKADLEKVKSAPDDTAVVPQKKKGLPSLSDPSSWGRFYDDDDEEDDEGEEETEKNDN